jgi:mRNA-degrading endonuclease toxin of MazEF toxin-antitoxin module
MTDLIECGGIYWVMFDPSVGHEYKGKRPAVVIQSDAQLSKTNLVTVMPLTSQISKSHKDNILVKVDKLNCLYADSLVKVHNIQSFDPARFIKKTGVMDDSIMQQIHDYLKIHFGIK